MNVPENEDKKNNHYFKKVQLLLHESMQENIKYVGT